jgi:tetratricopeptide (TPR) repeat protein
LDPGRVVPENYFNTEDELESAVLSAYAPMRSGNIAGRMYYFLNDLRDEHHQGTSALFPTGQALTRGQQTAQSGEITGHWTSLYLMIHNANTALDGIAANETVAEERRATLEAEARFLRGWAYNELATNWGGVPIYTSRVQSTEEFQPISPREEVFAQAQSDLQFAADNLPEERAEGDLGRATRGAALGLLGRSYMQSNDLDQARAALEAVVASDRYALNEEFFDNFIEENDFTEESLFEVVFAPIGDFNWGGATTGLGNQSKSVRAQEYGPSWRNVTPTSEIANLFENELAGCDYTDPRLSETVIFEGDAYANDTENLVINKNGPQINYHGTDVYANWYKYQVYYKRNPGGYYTSTTNYVIMRYADVLLLLAEIEARQGNLDQAREYVNMVRERAGVPDLEDSCVPSDTQDELIEAIVDERGKELASEAIRARDLRRWHEAGVINAADYLDYWSEMQLFLPIPLQEIITNTEITEADQNPGYN